MNKKVVVLSTIIALLLLSSNLFTNYAIHQPPKLVRKKLLTHKVKKYHANKYRTKKQTRDQIKHVFLNPHHYQYNKNREHQANFKVKLKHRRPAWQELVLFAGVSLIAWGGSHVGMNYPAYAQIAEFRAQNFMASIFEQTTSDESSAENTHSPQTKPSKYTKVETIEEPTPEVDLKPTHYARRVFDKMEIISPDNRLYIPRLNKNIPLITVPNHQNWNQLEGNIQKGLGEGEVVHPVSRDPSNFGNLFLTGHSSFYSWSDIPEKYKSVFALLPELKENDSVYVFWEGKRYKYKLRKSEIIPPTKTDVLNQPNDRSILTLMTCFPIGTNKERFIWVADLVEG